jgi:two-component system OmpR family response regulator
MDKPYYTTHEISRILKVDFTTVIDWCDQGKLLCYKTPGGHRRVRPVDLYAFMRRFGFPIPEELSAVAPLKMLVVDDEDAVRSTVSRMLKLTWPEAEVETAKDGFEAGKKTALLRPDAIVLDINLPGLDGFKVCELIRTDPLTSHSRILAISGNPDPQYQTRILAAGADVFLSKPFELEDLVARLKLLLRKPAETKQR